MFYPTRLALIALCALLAVGFLPTAAAHAQAPQLTVSDRQASRSYSLQDLLASPEVLEVAIARDPVYGRPMTYRAIPLALLLKGLRLGPDDDVQARATDNFSIGIPGRLLTDAQPGGPRAFLAIEDPARPWPVVPKNGATTSAGPLYIVWQDGGRSGISSEYWAYNLASLSVVDSPFKRFPGLAVGADVPAADPVRRGLDRYVAVCIACHRFNGEGEGEQGPDLARPMNPVDYLQPQALRKLLRNPESVRTWPNRQMPGFDAETLSDGDIDAIVAWLAYKARHP